MKILKTNDLVNYLHRKEGKKIKTPIAQFREIVGILSDLCYRQASVFQVLYANGKRRAARRRRKS